LFRQGGDGGERKRGSRRRRRRRRKGLLAVPLPLGAGAGRETGAGGSHGRHSKGAKLGWAALAGLGLGGLPVVW